ncbi:MAG: hypothetical protein KDA32_14055 [Phycisphaerales bacterium]|nr:hypothetical protein [Phycisphaerales bacterium]
MGQANSRQQRLHELIDFARAYRGWSRLRTAEALGRDTTKLYPNTDNPKLDLVTALASVLDWSIDDIVAYIRQDERPAAGDIAADYETLDQQARAAHCAGDFDQMLALAQQMAIVAVTPEHRARAANREHGAWDGMGRYSNALEAACRGLQEAPIPTRRRLQLQTNLANTHYTLWELSSALAHAHLVVEWYEEHPPTEPIDQKNQAFAWYVRGHAYRRSAAQNEDAAPTYWRFAQRDLRTARATYDHLAASLNDDRLGGIANTCAAGLIEVAVGAGELAPEKGVGQLIDMLENAVDLERVAGDWLESYGWACIFGANIALRRLKGRPLQQSMAIFTNKALDIAERLDHWALRERVFSMQYELHEALSAETGLKLPYMIDDEEKKLITGTMGRFPTFRRTGWMIFQTARLASGRVNGHV